MYKKIEGIVIKTTDYGESNKILTIYSREMGKVGAVARGAKKPRNRFVAVSQPFTYAYFVCYFGSGLGTLQQGESIEHFRQIKQDLVLAGHAAYVAELLDKATEERVRNPFLFELFLQTLRYLDEGYDPDIIKNIFEVKMLPILGLKPNFTGCALCGKTTGPYVFSVREGGFLCRQCSHHDPHHLQVSQATIKLLRLFSLLDVKKIRSINVKERTKKELELCISTYYDEYSGIYLKSRRFLKQLAQLHPPQEDV